jgi:hypothetical protein
LQEIDSGRESGGRDFVAHEKGMESAGDWGGHNFLSYF